MPEKYQIFVFINITSKCKNVNNITDFGGCQALLAQLLDLILHILSVQLQPRWHCASVGEG